MDLGAYLKIDGLNSIVERNGIHVERLRGYRLMGEEQPIRGEEYNRVLNFIISEEYRNTIGAVPRFSPHPAYHEYSERVRELEKVYLVSDENGNCDVRWKKLHGKRRKVMKYVKKLVIRRVKQQYDLWNKYCGRDDVLYIHARIGSCNWSGVRWTDYKNKPWFLAAVDDAFDSSYCDIYAKIEKG